MDLFTDSGTDEFGLPDTTHAPLPVRMRPTQIEEVLGQDHLLAPGAPLLRLLSGPSAGAPSIVLWGPPGTGKTTLAYLIARHSGRPFAELSAVSAGVKEVREVVAQARRHLAATGQNTVLFIDEVHRFSKAQQDTLLPAVENQWVTLVAATTENPSFSVISPLLSRSVLLVLNPLEEADVRTAVTRAVTDERGLDNAVSLSEGALDSLVRLAGADARKALTLLESAAAAALDQKRETIEPEDVATAASTALVRWDKDQHYDVASAFIKSMRGSDPDAAIHYLARMLEAGEDPRFVARRIMICASEDVGMADPSILPLTVAAAQAVAMVGMPEARIILSQAVLAVCMAPKSNSAITAIDSALSDLRKGNSGPVPTHLRDAHYAGAKTYGHGEGYEYTHNDPRGVSAQQFLPDALVDKTYYHPVDRGEEALITKRLAAIKKITRMG